MSTLKHIINQPFVFATGLAALIHSTWSLGTLFAGIQPDPSDIVQFLGWIVPALLIAFAMDIGQIVTSAAIRERGLTFARGATFATFAFATYYLQWLYIAHHMPAMDLSAGVRSEWTSTAQLLRDGAIWIIPALLPLATLLYTFSDKAEHDTEQTAHADDMRITIGEPIPDDEDTQEVTTSDFLSLPHHQTRLDEKNVNGAAMKYEQDPAAAVTVAKSVDNQPIVTDNETPATDE